MINKILKISLLGVLVCSLSYGTASKSPDSSKQSHSNDANETVLKYEEFLREETKLHGEYSQEYYDTILKLLSGIVIVGGGLLTWLNLKSLKDIKKHVDKKFDEEIDTILKMKLSTINDRITVFNEEFSKMNDRITVANEEFSKVEDRIKTFNKQFGEIDKQFGEIDHFITHKSDEDKLKNKKVLWVDDHPERNTSPIQILEQTGVKFSFALSTEEAMNKLKAEEFDLIISDMKRGGDYRAGIDLINQLKSKNIDTPIVISSYSKGVSQDIQDRAKEAIKLGAKEVTYRHYEIINTVKRLLIGK